MQKVVDLLGISFDQVKAIHKAFAAMDKDKARLVTDDQMLGAIVRGMVSYATTGVRHRGSMDVVTELEAQQVHHVHQEVLGARQACRRQAGLRRVATLVHTGMPLRQRRHGGCNRVCERVRGVL